MKDVTSKKKGLGERTLDKLVSPLSLGVLIALVVVGFFIFFIHNPPKTSSTSSVRQESIDSSPNNSNPTKTLELIDYKTSQGDCNRHTDYCGIPWKVEVRNNSEKQGFDVYVECKFMDSDGFQLSMDNETGRIKWNTTKTFTGREMMKRENYKKYSRYKCTLN